MAIYGSGSNITNTTDASAGTYGNANQVARVVIDNDGRVDSVSNVAITASINANASVGDIGTYAFLQQASGNSTYNPGSTLSGSSLRYSDATGRLYTANDARPSGTWRCMGYDSGAALTNSGSGTGSGSGSGNVSGSVSGNVSVPGKGTYGLSSGTVNSGSASVNVNTNVTTTTEVAYSATLWLRIS